MWHARLPVTLTVGGDERCLSALPRIHTLSGQRRRRCCVGHGRNMVGGPAVCCRSLRNGASRRHPCLNAFLSCVSTDTPQCCFSAAVSPQLVDRAVDQAQKLPPALTEVASKTSSCVRAWFACAGVRRRFKRVLAQAGVRTLILVVCCWCMCAGGHWGDPAGSEAAASSS